MASQGFAERIIEFLGTGHYSPKSIGQLAEAMGVGEAEMGGFHSACKALLKSGRVAQGAGNALLLPEPKGDIGGTFRRNPRGFGFVIPSSPNSHGDLYVAPDHTGHALTGDRVRVRVIKRGKRGGKPLYEGRVIEIVQRGQNRFVGELHHQGKRWFVIPDGNVLHVPIVVGDPGAKGAKSGDQVVVEIVEYPSDRKPAKGVILRILGRGGDPDVDTQSIIEQYGLPHEFDEAVLEEARQAIDRYSPIKEADHREDLRELTIITIDPDDARDFDDAVSIEQSSNGTVELGVHIADVAHFVKTGGALDQEAKQRANSVYLPRLVIPMLPEVLSNGVCSLQERQIRLTKSVFITYDRKGTVQHTRFANTIIRSAKRLTYKEVDKILDGKPRRTNPKVVSLLKQARDLARSIRERRLAQGMLVLDLPEVDLVFDENGHAVDVIPADEGFSHTLIEMFMVEANEAVARWFSDHNLPCLRRIHDAKSSLSDGSLRGFLRVLGFKLPAKAGRREMQALLEEAADTPQAFAVNLAILRSLAQAEYSPHKLGHFALASEHYCHFTSPIRRYPDLITHRLFDRMLRHTDKTDLCSEFTTWASAQAPPKASLLNARGSRLPGSFTHEELIDLGRHCSDQERRAEAAEREIKLVLTLRLLQDHLGTEMEGLVTGVANMGCFVQLNHYLVDGLLPFDHLGDDWWEVDPGHGTVVGQRSGKKIKIGDGLKVTLTKIHLPTRRLELALADPVATGSGRTKSSIRSTHRRRERSSDFSRGKTLQRRATRSHKPRRR